MAKTKILTKDGLEIYDTKIKDYIQSQVGETPEGVTYVDPDETTEIKSLKIKSEDGTEQNVFPKTSPEAVIDSDTGKTLDTILDEIDNRIANIQAGGTEMSDGNVIYMGTLGTDGIVKELPKTYKKGHLYEVATAGEYAGEKCDIGDFLLCKRNNLISLVGLPNVAYSDVKDHYVIYHEFNPITKEYSDAIIYMATVDSPYAYYDYEINKTDPYKVLCFSTSVKYISTNNGITWEIEGIYNYGIVEHESEIVQFNILYSSFDIQDASTVGLTNVPKSVAVPANPYTENSMDAFNADWTVIQGNIEGSIAEDVIYINPDDTSTEIEEIENVTSAKLVSYSNADSNIEATNVQDAIDEVDNAKVNVTDIVDNLESTAANKPLSAKQGNVLNEKIRENLLIYPYHDTTLSRDGITFTDNGDGTITVNGTNISTAFIDYSVCLRAGAQYVTAKYPVILPAGTYTFSGCPEGGSDTAYFMQIGTDDVSLNYKLLGNDYGQGTTFTLDTPSQIGIVIKVMEGVSITNKVFKPMLEVGNVTHEYKPYSLSKVTKGEVVDNLLSNRPDLPLSANQGAVLNESIESLLGHFYTFGSPSSGTKHRITDDLPTGIYFFTITDSTGPTVRAKPSMGTFLFDTLNKLAWINFQKSDDSSITGFTYSSTEGFVITTSYSKFITINLINMSNFNPTIPLVIT